VPENPVPGNEVTEVERDRFRISRDEPGLFSRLTGFGGSRGSRVASASTAAASSDDSADSNDSTQPRRVRDFGGPQGGFYVSSSLTLVLAADADLANTTPPLAGMSPVVEIDLGHGASLAGGWLLDNGLRGELELSYFQADFDTITTTAISGPADGKFVAISGMINIAYDAHFDAMPRWIPTIGAGIGISRVDSDLDSIGGSPTGLATEPDFVFSWQLIAGLGFAITEKIGVFGDYRYFATTDPDFGGFEAEIGIHKFSVSVRFSF
ncbi:MAG: outer membrane beta-barrel protein, partial [Alphaproteobacteria bacterium]|nr:outer membrane beta-barrel protein [Alphaproteobacteria bacterium]